MKPVPKRRDVRVDRLGFLKELVAWAEGKGGPKELLKGGMTAGDVVEGFFFLARLDPATCTTVSVSGILKLYEQQRISRSELVELLTVKTAEARKALDKRTFARLSRAWPGTPRLVIEPKEGVVVDLDQAVTEVGRGLTEDARARREKAKACTASSGRRTAAA